MAIKDAEAKYQEKQRRRRGLQKTRFYCQVCERQCLDENGFKCHAKSEVHMRNVRKQLQENQGSVTQIIEKYSEQFHESFLKSLRIHHGEKLVGLNKFYQEFISEKEHIHLNATRWRSLSSYARHLQSSPHARVVALGEDAPDERFLVAYVRARARAADPVSGPDPVSEPVSVSTVSTVADASLSLPPAVALALAQRESESEPKPQTEPQTENKPAKPAKPAKKRGPLRFALRK